MQENQRWIIAFALAALLLAVVGIVRHSRRSLPHEFEPVAPVRTPLREARPHSQRSGEPSADFGGDDFGGSRAAMPMARSGVHESTTPRIQPMKPVVTPMRRDSQRAGGGRSAAGAGSEEIPETPGIGPGGEAADKTNAAMVLKFDGSSPASTMAENGVGPITVQNVDPDPALAANRFPPNAELTYPDSGGIDPNEGTIAFWLHMEWDPTNPNIEGKSIAELHPGGWNNRMTIHMGPRFISFLTANSEGLEQGVGTAVNWQQNEWHHVAVTWGQALLSLYIDEALMAQNPMSGSIDIPQGTTLYVGSTQNKEVRPREGTISLRAWEVFQRALSQEEIGGLMTQTAPTSG